MAARASLAMSKWKKMMCEPRTLVKPSIPSLVGNSINSEMSNGVLSQGKLFFIEIECPPPASGPRWRRWCSAWKNQSRVFLSWSRARFTPSSLSSILLRKMYSIGSTHLTVAGLVVERDEDTVWCWVHMSESLKPSREFGDRNDLGV